MLRWIPPVATGLLGRKASARPFHQTPCAGAFSFSPSELWDWEPVPHAMTVRADWYRSNADLCREMAAKIVGDDNRAAWLDLSHTWESLVEAEERLDKQNWPSVGWSRGASMAIGSTDKVSSFSVSRN